MKVLLMLPVLLMSTAVYAENQFTGCLSRSGRLVRVAVGAEPLTPCTAWQTQITWDAKGDDGIDGANGEDGLNGFNGADGSDGRDGRDGKDGSAPKEFQYIGGTTSLLPSDMGFFGANRACSAEVHPESRMCYSAEIVGTVNPPIVDSDQWVQVSTTPTGSEFFDGGMSCGGWSRVGFHNTKSLVLRPGGRLRVSGCFEPRAVACCAVPE